MSKTIHERCEKLLRDIHTMTTKQYVNDSAMLIADLLESQDEMEDMFISFKSQLAEKDREINILSAENKRLVPESVQCHKRNDELVSENAALKAECKRLKDDNPNVPEKGRK